MICYRIAQVSATIAMESKVDKHWSYTTYLEDRGVARPRDKSTIPKSNKMHFEMLEWSDSVETRPL